MSTVKQRNKTLNQSICNHNSHHYKTRCQNKRSIRERQKQNRKLKNYISKQLDNQNKFFKDQNLQNEDVNNNNQPDPQQNKQLDINNFQQKIKLDKNKFLNSQYHELNSTQRCPLQDQDFQKTKQKLLSKTYLYHSQKYCVCQFCICGRHLCNLHKLKPDFPITKTSVYMKDYKMKTPYKNPSRRNQTELQKPKKINFQSTYKEDFNPRTQNKAPHRFKPQDLLKSGGPALNITTYSNFYPGFRGDNQYVKPFPEIDRSGVLSFAGQTQYKKNFQPKNGKKSNLCRGNDFFKVNEPWLGYSTYREGFTKPDKKFYPIYYKRIEKKYDDPNFLNQYCKCQQQETIYKNDFKVKGKAVCPAKTELQRRGGTPNQKEYYMQNSNFKAMNPQYHALSLSKISFV